MAVTAVTAHSASLNWQAATGANEYVLHYKPYASATWNTIKVKKTAYRLTGLHPSTLYQWNLQSLCEDAAD
jgi:hypothetical protein